MTKFWLMTRRKKLIGLDANRWRGDSIGLKCTWCNMNLIQQRKRMNLWTMVTEFKPHNTTMHHGIALIVHYGPNFLELCQSNWILESLEPESCAKHLNIWIHKYTKVSLKTHFVYTIAERNNLFWHFLKKEELCYHFRNCLKILWTLTNF